MKRKLPWAAEHGAEEAAGTPASLCVTIQHHSETLYGRGRAMSELISLDLQHSK